MFPFETLHKGFKCQEILLLPDHLCSTNQGGVDSSDSISTNEHTHVLIPSLFGTQKHTRTVAGRSPGGNAV